MESSLGYEPRYTYELVDYMFRTHSTYRGSDKWKPPTSEDLLNKEKKPVSTWIDGVSSLYKPEEVSLAGRQTSYFWAFCYRANKPFYVLRISCHCVPSLGSR